MNQDQSLPNMYRTGSFYSQDKHYLCANCFKPSDWQPDDIIVSPREWAGIDKCCVCGLNASYGAIVQVDIPGPCCGSHWRKAEQVGRPEIRPDGIRPDGPSQIPSSPEWIEIPYLEIPYLLKPVESNLPYFERMIAKWDAQGPGQPDGVRL